MDNDTKTIGGGLLPTPHDERDLNFGQLFGLPMLSELPAKYRTAQPLKIKNQGNSDLCTAFAVTAASEMQELTELSPEFQFAQTKKLLGDWQPWGADLRSAIKSAVKIGSIQQMRVPQELTLSLDNSNRDKIANWNNWPTGIELYATRYKKMSYFSIAGQYTTFDNFRAVLWQNRAEERAIVTGVTWQNHWTGNARITDDNGQQAFGHAFTIFGFEDEWLVAQLSNGESIGENGIFYFHRDVVNKQFKYGGYTFKDMEPEKAKYYARKGIKITDSWITRLLIALWR